MLHFFLLKVSELHLNTQDSDMLYRKIAKLFLKMLLQRGIQDLKKSTNQKLNYIVMTSEDDARYFQKYEDIRQLSSRFWCKRGVTKNNKGFPRGVSELGIILFLKMKNNIVILSRYC